MIEVTHLRIMQALAENGSLTAAANALFVTQSALSHQIRYLEQKLEVTLWQREGRKLRLTQSGELLLNLARQVLPVIDQAEATLGAYAQGRQGVLRLGVECHPCYEWLKAILAEFMPAMPKVDVDIVHKFQFSGLEGLLNHHIDVLVTPDPVKHKAIHYEPMFGYELVLLTAQDHPLSSCNYVEPHMLEKELLLTFPVARERLDVFSQFLLPAGVNPRHKTLESLEIMVQMVSLQRGVTVLPDWMARNYCQTLPVQMVKLGKGGLAKSLYAAMHEQEKHVNYIEAFVSLGKLRGALVG